MYTTIQEAQMQDGKEWYKRAINWLGESFQEEKTGKVSARRITAFALTSLNFYMVVFDKIPSEYRLNIYYANLLVVCLILAIVTVDHVLTILNK